ncbi:MAG: hypothetical protein ACTS3F_00520 [Phycisphaerales bacterium]
MGAPRGDGDSLAQLGSATPDDGSAAQTLPDSARTLRRAGVPLAYTLLGVLLLPMAIGERIGIIDLVPAALRPGAAILSAFAFAALGVLATIDAKARAAHAGRPAWAGLFTPLGVWGIGLIIIVVVFAAMDIRAWLDAQMLGDAV